MAKREIGPSIIVMVRLTLRDTNIWECSIHSRDCTVAWRGDAPPSVLQLMEGKTRTFFKAHTAKKNGRTRIFLDKELPDQGW